MVNYEEVEEFVDVLGRCGMLYGVELSNEEWNEIYEREKEFVKMVNELNNKMIEVVCEWNEVRNR